MARQHRVGLDHRGQPLGGAQQAIDNPGLASDFGGEPAAWLAICGPEHREDQQPQQPALLEQRPAPEVQEPKPATAIMRKADRHHEVKELKADSSPAAGLPAWEQLAQPGHRLARCRCSARKLSKPGMRRAALTVSFFSSTQPNRCSGALAVV